VSGNPQKERNEDNFDSATYRAAARGANERTSGDLEPRYTSRIARKVEYSVKCVSEWKHKRASMARPVPTRLTMRHGSPQKQQLREK